MLGKIFTKRKILISAGVFLLLLLVASLSFLVYLVFPPQERERLNFVLLGESGPAQVGGNLTDTIIFFSIAQKGTVLVSVPRDLWYQPWQTKINSLYYYGEQRGHGLNWTKEILGEILGQKIDYALLVDFEAFKDLVDLVGGIEAEVERTFDDFLYPIAGRENDLCAGDPEFKCRYEHVRFEAGRQHFNGEQALKFVRSRYAQGEEGTDLARAVRQQRVLLALKEKITSPSVFFSPGKVRGLLEIFEKRVKTDVSQEDLVILAKILLRPKARELQSFVINDWSEAKGLIYHPQKHPSGQWVLLPKDATWGEIHQFIACLLFQEDKSSCSPGKKQETPNF